MTSLANAACLGIHIEAATTVGSFAFSRAGEWNHTIDTAARCRARQGHVSQVKVASGLFDWGTAKDGAG